jgi:acetyl-CoA carboxylase biotin carboxyl carrier protein
MNKPRSKASSSVKARSVKAKPAPKQKAPAARDVAASSKSTNGVSIRSRSSAVRPAGADAASEPAAAQTVVEMVRELAAILSRRNLAEVIVDTGEVSITLRSAAGVVSAPAQVAYTAFAPASEPSPAALSAEGGPAAVPAADDVGNGQYQVVNSPFVGTFYRAPAPDANPFVEVGTRVEKGQVLCIVEAMKLMNEIEADHAGTIAAILVENSQPVEYGQPLFKIAAG